MEENVKCPECGCVFTSQRVLTHGNKTTFVYGRGYVSNETLRKEQKQRDKEDRDVDIFMDPCWITMASYGSPYAAEINSFRKFRNCFMQRTTFGKKLIKLYYLTAPPIAIFISNHRRIRFFTRNMLEFIRKRYL